MKQLSRIDNFPLDIHSKRIHRTVQMLWHVADIGNEVSWKLIGMTKIIAVNNEHSIYLYYALNLKTQPPTKWFRWRSAVIRLKGLSKVSAWTIFYSTRIPKSKKYYQKVIFNSLFLASFTSLFVIFTIFVIYILWLVWNMQLHKAVWLKFTTLISWLLLIFG